MAYEKQNFTDGLTLFASQLNHMEDGIAQNASDIAAKVGIKSFALTKISTVPGDTNSWLVTLTDGSTIDITVRNGGTGASGKNGSDGAGIYLWDSTAEPSYVEDDGTKVYSFSSVTRPDGSNITHGDMLLDYDGNLYLVEGVNMVAFKPVFQFRIAGSGSGGSGEAGADGFSPVAKVTQTGTGAVITITDKSGTTTATITNGKDGADGTSATHSWNGTVLTVSSASGTSSADLKGSKGDKGDKGDSIKGDKGDPGNSGVYILSDGETVDDAPSDANVIIDPNGSADSSGSGGLEVGGGSSASQPSSGAVVGSGRKIKTTELTLTEDTNEVRFDLQNYTDCELFFEMETGVATKAKFGIDFPAINSSLYRNYGLQTAVSFQYKIYHHIRIFNDNSGDNNRHIYARNKNSTVVVNGAYWTNGEDGFFVKADAAADVLPTGTKIRLTEIYWEG